MIKDTIARKKPGYSELTVKQKQPMWEATEKAAAQIRELSI